MTAAAAVVFVAPMVFSGGACSGARAPRDGDARARVAAALAPGAVAAALAKLGDAHWRAKARFSVGRPGPAGWTEGVTTTTDVWLDRAGNYRLVEGNDADGGREVVLYGRELNVALRYYGKMIRRRAEEPEPSRLLAEAVSAPGAAWDLVGHFAGLDPLPAAPVNGRPAAGFQLSRSQSAPEPAATGTAGEDPLRSWRQTVQLHRLEGEVRLDEATSAPLTVVVRAAYGLKRDGHDLRGEIDLRADIDGVGSTPAIARPDAAEDLPVRQRTVPEERALLGGLGGQPTSAAAGKRAERRP